MLDPASLTMLLSLAASVREEMDAQQLRDRVADVQTTVHTIRRHLDEEILVDLRTGFAHLATAVETGDRDVARDELSAARGYLARLENRHAGAAVEGDSGSLSGAEVVALALFGDFYYFALRGDDRTALLHAFRCAASFPVLAVQLLPEELFAKPYRTLIVEHRVQWERSRAEAGRALAEYRADRRRRVVRALPGWAWTATKWAGAGVGGALVGCVYPAGGIQVFVRGRNLAGDFQRVEPAAVRRPLETDLADEDPETRRLLDEMADEAARRVEELMEKA